MAEIYIKRDWQNHLIPTDEYSLGVAKKIKQDAPRLVTITNKRNIGFHQKFFVMLNTIFELQTMFGRNEFTAFRYWMICKAGFYTIETMPGGEKVAMAKSISFASMDEMEFQKVYDKVINVALEHKKICGGISEADLLKEAESKIMQFV